MRRASQRAAIAELMPISGTLDVATLLEDAPVMDGYGAEPWAIAGVETLQVAFEIDERAMPGPLPPALHPTIPPTLMISVTRYPESPVGPFTLAQARLGCRAAALPRGFLLRACVDSQMAADALGHNWGYRCAVGVVRVQRYHDRITGSAHTDGVEILRASLIDPTPISGGDIQYVANMNLARVRGEDGGALIQVDPEYTFHRAERGRPELTAFDRAAWRADGVDPVWPIVASFTTCDSGFPRIRFVLDPLRPAVAGTRRVDGG
ncbi:MAG TPA: acetoacetate decarboxylase family protein [Dehalococcoidia bacterium]|nr:acetoacetate decarboxylase family protein [Dehalococcoidia bacterium]